MIEEPVNIFWFRRDLRLHDNAALYEALKLGKPVVSIFIFDKFILDQLDDKADRRVAFIHHCLEELQKQLVALQSGILVFHGFPTDVFKYLGEKYRIEKVFTNHDYEPYAQERDGKIRKILEGNGITLQTFKDQVVFEKSEVVKDNGQPYTIFTPYSRKWKTTLQQTHLPTFQVEKYFQHFEQMKAEGIPALEEIGFKKVSFSFPVVSQIEEVVKSYATTRDFPAIKNGTSRIGVHLRFGTVSIRKICRMATSPDSTYLNELIWREFYQMILWQFPKVGEGFSFKKEFDRIEWRNNEDEFEKWCNGKTGYPLVDAGMRELNETGFMHNRVRMVVASFLTKHLLIDWRWGEAYFAAKLLDYELASNNGGWQWAAGSGCDAAPYFRIFNPHLQATKYDKGLEYIQRWLPELNEFSYPQPIVEHEYARKRALEVYGKALKK